MDGAPEPRPVLIACPRTFDLVRTGVEVASLEKLEERYVLEGCESCGQTHEWTPYDAVIVET